MPDKNEGNAPGTALTDPIAAPAANNTPAAPAALAAAPATPSWRDTLPDDLKADPSLAPIQDVAALAKSFVNAQKLIGKKAGTVHIPDQHASEDDWKNFFEQLGHPKDAKDYKLEVEKDSGLDESFVGAFKENAHKLGILPKQAQSLLKWYTDASKQTMGAFSESQKNQEIEHLKGLQKEWGDSYQKNLLAAQLVLKDFGDDETIKFLNESRLGNNPNLLKLLSKVGSVLKEEDIKGEVLRRGGDANAMTPEMARAETAKIMGNFDHPYYKKSHPEHASAVANMQKLMNYAYPQEKK